MKRSFEIEVYGTPQPQGSVRAFVPKGWSRPILTTDNPRLKSWRQEVTKAAIAARPKGFPILAGNPVHVSVIFYFRPTQKTKAGWKCTRPDVDKLLRGVLDALAGVAYEQDSQVATAYVQKLIGAPERTWIEVKEI